MDSETVHGTVRSGAGSVPEAGPLFWRSVDAGWKRQKHGDGLPVLRPGQTGSSLPEKGLHTATGAAGDEDNEKMVKKRPPQSRGGQKSFMTYHWH